MELPVPVAQWPSIVRHNGLEGLFPDAVFPDVLNGLFAKTEDLRHNATAG